MGGLNLMLTYIMTNSPTAKIGVITPAKCICNGNSSFLEVNSKGNTLLDYCNAIEEVCAKYGAPCYNLYKNCNKGGGVNLEFILPFYCRLWKKQQKYY